MDEIITNSRREGMVLSQVVLNYDKKLKILRGFEHDAQGKKRYMEW